MIAPAPMFTGATIMVSLPQREDIVADFSVVLVHAVIVASDRTGADVQDVLSIVASPT